MTVVPSRELSVVGRELLTAELCDDLLTLYGADTGDGSERFWFCVRPHAQVQLLREVLHPILSRHRSLLAGGPVLTTPGDAVRYARILPQEVASFLANARLLVGEDLLEQTLAVVEPDHLHSLAWLAAETLIGSAVVASPDGDWRQSTGSVLRLSERLLRAAGRAGIVTQSPEEALEGLHAHLSAESERYPAYLWQGKPPAALPPRHLPGLLALVTWGERLVVVLPAVNPETLASIGWLRVADLVRGELETVLIATPWQLRLVASVAEAVSLTFRSFELAWGADILADCRPSDEDVRLSSAALPVRTLVQRLPAEYLMAEESELGSLIHAVQNVLQNIQIRSELWARIRGVQPKRPPEPLPGRESPSHQRVEALFRQLRWWTDRWSGSATS